MSKWEEFEILLSQDQAVLAEVVRRSEKMGHRIGRTALQKIPYFLKRRGVPLDYAFDLYHYGPFCQEILYDAHLLESLDVVVDGRDGYNGGSRYSSGKDSEAQLSEHTEFLEAYSDEIEAVVKLLAPLDATTLEIVATIDYFYRYAAAGGGQGPFKDEVMRRFIEAKPKYSANRKDVEKVYDQMAGIGMVEP